MAWPFVTGAASQSLAVTKAVTAGDFLVVFYGCNSSGALTPTVSDNGSTPNTWVPVQASPLHDASNDTMAMWYCIAKVTGSITVTIAGGGATFNETSIGEWTPPFPAVIEEVSASVAGAIGSAAADGDLTGSVTTVADGDLIISFIMDIATLPAVTQFTAGSNPNVFTKRATASNDPGGAASGTFAIEDFVQAVHGAINPTWTAANADNYSGITVAFKAVVANVASSRIFRAGRGPGAGPAMRRMAPQQFPTPGPTDAIIPGPQIQPLRSRGPGMGPRLRRMVPQRLQDAGATTTTLLPTEGAITIAGVAASLTLTIAAVAGAITIAGNAPSVTTVLQGVQGSVVIAGNTASTTSILAPVVGAVVISGSATALTQTLVGVTGAVTIGGSAPSLTGILVATEGAVVIGGNVPSIIVSSGLTPSEGAITLAGNAPDLLAALSVSEGAISIVGNSPDIPNISISPIDGASNFSLSKWRKWHRPEDERELRKLRLTPAVAEIIVEVAERQAAQLDLDEQQRLEELTRKLELKGLQWQGRYLELLNAQRQQLIDEEIGRLMRETQAELQRRDEEAILLLLTII